MCVCFNGVGEFEGLGRIGGEKWDSRGEEVGRAWGWMGQGRERVARQGDTFSGTGEANGSSQRPPRPHTCHPAATLLLESANEASLPNRAIPDWPPWAGRRRLPTPRRVRPHPPRHRRGPGRAAAERPAVQGALAPLVAHRQAQRPRVAGVRAAPAGLPALVRRAPETSAQNGWRSSLPTPGCPSFTRRSTHSTRCTT